MRPAGTTPRGRTARIQNALQHAQRARRGLALCASLCVACAFLRGRLSSVRPSAGRQPLGDDRAMNADGEVDLDRELALYRSCCAQVGMEPLPDDDVREVLRHYRDVLLPAFEREFRLH